MSKEAAAFVGRETELAALEVALDEVLTGRGRLVVIGGEPGIGKSRLTDEFAARARSRGVRVLWGHSWEAGGAPPFWPWIECLRAYAEVSDPEGLREDLGPGGAEVAQMMPELRRILPDLPELAAGDAEAARFRLFDATTTFLRNAGARAPLALILEDLHAADEPSLLLLRFVARVLPRAGIMVLGTYRDTELSREHPLWAALAEVAREPSTTRLALRGLTREDVARFVEAVAGPEPGPQLVTAVYRETEGNPLFVGEVVRLLAGEGRLDRPPAADAWSALIPQGIREVIDRRLSRLSDRCLQVLARGSVVGREFSIEVVQWLDGMTRAELLDALDEAAAARVVSEAPAGLASVRFSHQLIRDALYDGLPRGQRAALHRRVAEALVQLHGADPGPLLAELAHHFFRAAPGGDASRAVEYCTRAGDRAAAVLAYEEAVRLYEMALRALDLLPDAGEKSRCDLLVRLGEAQARAGDAVAARGTFLRAADVAERLGMPEHLARAALGYGGRFVWARAAGDPQLVPLLERALAQVGSEFPHVRARLLARLAGALRDEADPRRRDDLSREAVEIARRLDDPAALGYVLDGRWAAIWGPDTTRDRLALAGELIRIAEDAGDRERSFQGHHYRMACLLELGDVAGARAELDAKGKIAAELRQPAQRWYLVTSRALLAAFEGRLAEAERQSEEALAIGERAYSTWDARFNHLVRLFIIRRDQGRLAELERAIREAVPAYEMSYPFVRALLALLLVETGRAGDSRPFLEGLVTEERVTLPRDNEWLFGMATVAEVASMMGDRERADLLYDHLVAYAGTNVLAPIEAMIGSVDRPLGLLAATNERWAEAERHLAEAEKMNRRMGAAPALARTLLDHGGVLMAGPERGARDRAAGLLREAVRIAGHHGLVAVARGAESLLRDLGQTPIVERVRRAFMFTDVVGSTALLEAIGDEGWEDLRAWHDRRLRELFAEHRGEEVDHAGDGFFVTFATAREALACAVAIQRSLTEHRRTQGFAPQVRIGLHVGEATRSAADYGGKAVHVAARIGALAEGGEILSSGLMLRDLPKPPSILGRRTVTLKGIKEPVEVAAVEWRAS